MEPWDFPGGLVVRIPCFHCCGPPSVPGWGTEIPQDVQSCQKKKRKKLTFYFLSHPCLLKAVSLLQNKIQDTENHTQGTANIINYYNCKSPCSDHLPGNRTLPVPPETSSCAQFNRHSLSLPNSNFTFTAVTSLHLKNRFITPVCIPNSLV